MLGNDVAVFVREFGANAEFATVRTSNSDERYGIPKSGEFLSLVKFDVWFCDSLVHLSDSI